MYCLKSGAIHGPLRILANLKIYMNTKLLRRFKPEINRFSDVKKLSGKCCVRG